MLVHGLERPGVAKIHKRPHPRRNIHTRKADCETWVDIFLCGVELLVLHGHCALIHHELLQAYEDHQHGGYQTTKCVDIVTQFHPLV